jgi:sugar phosphate isomerase/epimerase
MLGKKNFRIAYENWCWATHAPYWSQVWDIVQKVDRPNIGLCLDTFQTGGGEWGDPTTKSGKIETMSAEELERKFKESLESLSANVPPEKIFFLQISDAYIMDPPLDKKPDEQGLRPRGRWSHDYRPLPYDGGYLPVVEFTKAVLGTGFRGWMSIEVFDGQAPQKYPDDMGTYAKKAMSSLERLLEEAGV